MAAQAIHLNWFNPVHIHFGPDWLKSVPADVPVVVLADRRALGYTDETQLLEQLGARCKGWCWTLEAPATVDHARQLCEELWPLLTLWPGAAVMAIGGGTTLDLAKVLRFRFTRCNMLLSQQHWRNNTLPDDHERHPLWAVPTTAGTGSEVTRWATLWDPDANPPQKRSWAPANGYADLALIDPGFLTACPPRIVRDCALDALSHALEALWNRNASPATNELAVKAARLVLATLPLALQEAPEDGWQTDLASASLMAGLAMSQTQTALAHALSYGLTLGEGIPHGEACAVWLPMAWDMALGVRPQCDAALARVWDVPLPQGPELLHQWLRKLRISPRDLRSDAQGQALLTAELQSARGRNFIASV